MLEQTVAISPETLTTRLETLPGESENASTRERPNQRIEVMQQLGVKLDNYSLEDIVEVKISRFLDQLSSFHPENLYGMIMGKVEKPLIKQILQRTGGNQVHAAKILGINRNTLRKKMKIYGF